MASAAAVQAQGEPKHLEPRPYPDFIQDPPRLGNAYVEDAYLQSLLQRLLGDAVLAEVTPDLTRFGARCATDLAALAADMEIQQPYLQQYDSWGGRVDELHTCASWKAQHVVAAEEGIIATGYERRWGAKSRVVQFAKLMLYGPSSGLFNCPLAMTDGATRLCELLLDPTVKLSSVSAPLSGPARAAVQEAYSHLTSRDGNPASPRFFWTSGQWMTERGGGSDVGDGTRTVARLQPDGSYRLYGFKWFTSATDAQMTITLARVEDAQGRTIPGNKGLTCFILRVKNDDGSLNNIRIHKLKNKLGTKQLPTAELELLGSVAHRLSDLGRGIPLITTLVNITRLYNAIASIGFMRRMQNLMQDYAHRRVVFGRTLAQNSLHIEMLAECEVQVRAATAFSLDVAARLGRAEVAAEASEEDHVMLRLLTPLVKLYTAKQAVALASEGLESFGGQGYIEDSKLPRLLRDAQVLSIWEGTTNVLSHDLLRVLATSKGQAFEVFKRVVARRIAELEAATLEPEVGGSGDASALRARQARVVASLRAAQSELEAFVSSCLTGGKAGAATLEAQARALAFATSRVYMASTLAVHAVHTKDYVDFVTLERWVLDGDTKQSTAPTPLIPATLRAPLSSTSLRVSDSRLLGLNLDPKTKQPRVGGNVNKDGTPRSKL